MATRQDPVQVTGEPVARGRRDPVSQLPRSAGSDVDCESPIEPFPHLRILIVMNTVQIASEEMRPMTMNRGNYPTKSIVSRRGAVRALVATFGAVLLATAVGLPTRPAAAQDLDAPAYGRLARE